MLLLMKVNWMAARHGVARRAWAGVVLTIAVAALAVLSGPRPASAHTALRGSTPAAGAQMVVGPAVVSLDFAEPPDASLVQVAVLDPAGTELAAGPAEVAGTVLRQPVRPVTIAGTVTVNYRIASADGHPVQGTIAYTVTSAPPAVTVSTLPSAAPAATTPAAVAPSAVVTGGAGPQRLEATGTAAVLMPVGLLVSMIGLAAALAFWPRRRTPGPDASTSVNADADVQPDADEPPAAADADADAGTAPGRS